MLEHEMYNDALPLLVREIQETVSDYTFSIERFTAFLVVFCFKTLILVLNTSNVGIVVLTPVGCVLHVHVHIRTTLRHVHR